MTLPILAVCASGIGNAPAYSVAVRTSAGVVTAASPAGSRGDLAELTRRALAEAGIGARDLRAIAVDRGPGSYIGIRVAATFARTLAAFAPAELLAVDSLQAAAVVAAVADRDAASARRAIVLDGRQQRLQVAIHRLADGKLETAIPARLIADAELAALLAVGDRVHVDAAAAPRIAGAIAAARAVSLPLPPLTAVDLLSPEVPRRAIAPTALEPLYLAGSYVG